MSAQPADPRTPDTWAPSPGEPAVLRLDPDSGGLSVRIASHMATAARETPFEKLIHTPAIWGSALASLAVFVLVSTAFATGTVRPAPPRVPTPRPGEPTPTPDTRPKVSIGGFELEPPLQPTAVPPTPVSSDAQDPTGTATPRTDDTQPLDETTAPDVQPTPEPCTNPFGFGCGAPAPPPRPLPPRRLPQTTEPSNRQPIVPVASPAALDDAGDADLQVASPGPPRGSNLEAALQAASLADDNFAREVDPSSREASSQDGTPPRSPSSGFGP